MPDSQDRNLQNYPGNGRQSDPLVQEQRKTNSILRVFLWVGLIYFVGQVLILAIPAYLAFAVFFHPFK